MPLRAAAARRVVTPDPLLPVTSGAGAARPAREKLMELEARALVLEQGETAAALVSLPFIGWPGHLCQRIRGQVAQLPPERIVIGVTHTHTAPEVYGFPDDSGEYAIDLPYLYSVCDAAAEAIQEAWESRKPATLRCATGEARGKIAYNLYAPELYDPRCHVLQFSGADGSAIATLVNYAIHPEVLLNREVCSPDLIGPLQDHIEERFGGTALFFNGAQGGMVTADIRHPEGDREEWSECERIGRLLASEAARIIEGAPMQSDPTLWCGAQTLEFAVKETMQQFTAMLHPEVRAIQGDLARVQAQQNLINLGDAQLLTIPGEALPNIGYYLKRNMRGRHNLLLGLTNDAFGYMLTRVDYDSFPSYDYISAVSLGEETGEILIAESLKLIGRAPAPAV